MNCSNKEWKKLQHMSFRDLIFSPLAREHMHYEYVTENIIKFKIYREEKENG